LPHYKLISNHLFKKKYPNSELVWPLLIGMAAFLIVVGPLPLIFTNTAWLIGADPSQRQLGWELFRYSPWILPLGLNPKYGLEISSSIVFSDSIPILALFFKSISAILPDSFQYFGFWILGCFLLQALFSWLIASLITDRTSQKICVCILLGVFSLPMIKRLGIHASIMAHFFVLAAIYLNFKPNTQNRIWWYPLLISSTLTHFYLLAIVGALWAASCADFFLIQTKRYKNALVELLIVLISIGCTAWFAGFILNNPPSLGAEGFGLYKLNVLSIFDAHQWSYVLPSIPHPEDLEEGFNFLGLGMLFLFPFALAKVFNLRFYWSSVVKQHPFYCLMLLALTLIALTNNMSIGNYTSYFYLPPFILKQFEILRSSGRLFWPVFYTICLFILVLVIRGYSPKKGIALLIIACILQVIDSSAGWLPIRNRLEKESRNPAQEELIHPFWSAATAHYTKIKVFPLKAAQTQLYWYQFAHLAAKNRIGTNAVYLGRSANVDSVKTANEHFEEAKSTGNYDIDTLYILDEWKNNPASTSPKVNPEKDLLATIDGFIVLAPNWKICKVCPQLSNDIEIAAIAPMAYLNKPILFSKSGEGHIFLQQLGSVEKGYGWSFPEAWGVWSDGAYANLALPLPKQNAHFLQINAQILISKKHPRTDILIEINQSKKIQLSLDQEGLNTFIIPIPSNLQYPNFLDIRFHFLNPTTPIAAGIPGNDQRKLGLGLISATFLP